jgi:hypothetical protein
MLYRDDSKIHCAGINCDWEGIKSKRVDDNKLSTLGEIKNAWGLG